MGLDLQLVNFIETSIKENFKKIEKLKMLELGDQIFWNKGKPTNITGKEYFTNLGYEHISVDLNGDNGSLIKDLRNPKDFVMFKDTFDIITNSGTTEHVEPFEKQYVCFKILHDCLKINGIFIHILPDISENEGKWKGHCKFYYSLEFFEKLSRECGYEIVKLDNIRGLLCVALIKRNQQDFLLNKEIFEKYILIKD